MRRRNSFFCVAAFVTITSLSLAQAGSQKNKVEAPAPSTGGGHHVVTPDKVEWTHPPFVPHGASLAVIAGDPSKAGDLYTIRIKSIAGLKVPPHWHPEDEHLTVVKGTFMIAVGEKYDQTALHAMPVGSYCVMPKEMRHFAFSKGETIVQVHGVGPFKINYVNPADDPQNKTSSK
jgi:hypothetical protein